MARRGVRLVVAVSLGSTLGSIGCFGPLDSPLLPPRRDTGVDLRMEVAVDRRPDIAIVDVTPPDAADAGRPDARDALDAGGVLDAFDARVAGDARDGADARNPIDASDAAPPSDASDARVIFDMRPPPPDLGGWPTVPGCVTGFPPVPEVLPTNSFLTIGCGPVSRVVARVDEASGQGMVISAVLDPPLRGLAIAYTPTLCQRAPAADILVNATGTAGLSPGVQLATTLRVQVQGPAGPSYAYPLTFTVMATNFGLETDTIDFGTVLSGSFLARDLIVNNLIPGAPIGQLAEAPVSADPFFFALPALGTPALEAGTAAALVTIFLSPSSPGKYQSTFTLSPFVPGVFVDPTCGAPRMLTLSANVVAPPPLP